jgi:hypothetical protein
VIVTVVAVGVVQVAINEVVGVIAVRHRFMTAAGTVLVSLGMLATVVLGRTGGRILAADRQLVFLDTTLAHVVQVPVVQVIYMTLMFDARVATTGTMLMRVVGMGLCAAHGSFSFGVSVIRFDDGCGWSAFQLGGVRQRVVNQIGNMPICQCIIQVSSFPPAAD